MKKIFLQVFLFFTLNLCWGQSNFGLKILVYPNVSDVTYETDEAFIAPSFPSGIYEDIEVPSFSFSAGIGAQMELSDRVAVSLGVNYVRTGYETKKISPNAAVEPGDPVLDIFPDEWKYRYRQVHLEVPLQMSYSVFQQEKWSLYLLTGPSVWFNLKNQTVLVSTKDGKKERDRNEITGIDFHSTNVVLTGGLGVSFKVDEKLSLLFQPTGQMALFEMAKNELINRRIHNFGLTLGAVFR